MKQNLIELHSVRAKFFLNLYIVNIIMFSILLFVLVYQSVFQNKDPNYIIYGMVILVILISLGMYYYSFLGYLDVKGNILILKKPFRKKEWKINLEDIISVDKERLFITKGKHIKLSTYNKDKTDTIAYYILTSRFEALFGSDDAEYLWEQARRRKNELKRIT